jgi:putative endonuclease
MSFYTYIIYSQTTELYYAGITNNLKNRLLEHNKCKTKTTAKARDWNIVYSKQFSTRKEAYDNERYIKGIGPKRFYESLKIGTNG